MAAGGLRGRDASDAGEHLGAVGEDRRLPLMELQPERPESRCDHAQCPPGMARAASGDHEIVDPSDEGRRRVTQGFVGRDEDRVREDGGRVRAYGQAPSDLQTAKHRAGVRSIRAQRALHCLWSDRRVAVPNVRDDHNVCRQHEPNHLPV